MNVYFYDKGGIYGRVLQDNGELRLERNAKRTKITMFLEKLESSSELVTEFDEELWYSTVDFVTVYEDMVCRNAG